MVTKYRVEKELLANRKTRKMLYRWKENGQERITLTLMAMFFLYRENGVKGLDP
jgi:hypothetical protein